MGGIFLRQGESFIPMREAPYEAERVLQELLAEHPEVLAGDELSDGAWLLVKREAGVPDDPATGGRWSLDHLFLDADGVPTLVEVKRGADTRVRREVVAQMLDYAANAASYWTGESLKTWFEAECETDGKDPNQALVEAFAAVGDPDDYWAKVQTNLAAGKLRLVFVSDAIPGELRRIVEFLNAQMAETEVLAIEVKQYVDADGQRQTIVPSVLGQTEAARRTKGRSPAGRWDRDSLLAQIETQCGRQEAQVAARIIDWADRREDLRPFFGRGRQDGSFTAGHLDPDRLFPFVLYGYGRVEIQFEYIRRRPPFNDRELRQEFQAKLNAIPGVEIPLDAIDRRPSIPLSTFTDQPALDQFLAVLDWAFDQVKA